VEAIAPADSLHAVGSGEPKVQVRAVGIAGWTEPGDRQTYNGVEGEPQQGGVCGESNVDMVCGRLCWQRCASV
jgi:hypothetical protein